MKKREREMKKQDRKEQPFLVFFFLFFFSLFVKDCQVQNREFKFVGFLSWFQLSSLSRLISALKKRKVRTSEVL